MRLISLHIKGYKNIQDLPLDFSNKDGITLLIGNNGAGKSNIVEAISSIFAGLYNNKLHKPNFDYALIYELNGNNINTTLIGGQYRIIVNDRELSQAEFQQKSKDFLPENVIACYSGESLRLFENYYKPYYKQYIDAIKKEDQIPTLPMLYVNKYNIKIALLTLFFCDWTANTDVANFCTNILHIKDLKKIKFHYNNKNILSWKRNAIVQMIENINAIDGKGFISPDACEFNSINDLKQKLNYLDERTFFHFMYAATMPLTSKAIEEIDIEFELSNGTVVTIEELSEGEKKYLLIKTILEFISTENSLILFDEPDAHIHINRKAELKDIISLYNNRENIITTHSPTLAMCFDNTHLEGLGTNKEGYTIPIGKDKAKLISQITNGMWNVHEQNAFLASNKPITLLVEGKTDKIHLKEAFKHLKPHYPDLDFDIFSMNSSEHIRETLIGLSCSEINWERKFIGIFDNDSAGQKDINNGFEKEAKNEKIKHVKYKDGKPSSCFYAFLLPIKTDFSDNAFTIENCYAPEKYQAAFKQALKEKEGHFGGLSIDKIADDLKNKAKTILAEQAKSFDAVDFESFRQIFNFIEEIRNL